MMLKVFTANDIRRLLPIGEAVDAMREAFSALSNRSAQVPLRTTVDMPDGISRSLFMPVCLPETGLAGIKSVSIFPRNSSTGLPTLHGLMMIFSAENGQPIALMNAEALTAIRTGAASGLATDLLARRDATTLGLFGTGGQAGSQVEGIMAVRTIRKIYVFGRNKEKAATFAARMHSKHLVDCVMSADPRDLHKCDIICTATTSNEPVFEDTLVKSGAHINGIGSYKKTMREIPVETLNRALVFVDQREAVLAEAGDLAIPISEGALSTAVISGEIGDLVLGKIEGRHSDDEVTVFKSVGNAVQDLAAAAVILKRKGEVQTIDV